MVVESVTHRALADYERERILQPANMNETTCGDPLGAVDFARGYMTAAGTRPPAYSPSWFFADGDIVSTASDVARFDVALLAGRLIKPATFSEMQSSAASAEPLGKNARYALGLGLSLASAGGMMLVGHHGGVPGYVAENEIEPTSGFAIVVPSDAYDFATAIANRAIVRQTFPSLFENAPNPIAAATPIEDPAVTAKLRAFLRSIQQGTIDPGPLSQAMIDALTPAVISGLRAKLADFSTLSKLTFRSYQSTSGFAVFRYDASYSGPRTTTLTLVLDAQGKIASFRL